MRKPFLFWYWLLTITLVVWFAFYATRSVDSERGVNDAKVKCFTQNMMLVVKYHKDGKVDYDCAPLFPEFGNPKI